jgi:hypothetical protein
VAIHKVAQDRVGPEWVRTHSAGPDRANLVARIVGVGPMVYAVWWKRDVHLRTALHRALNTLAVALTARAALSLFLMTFSKRPQGE